MPLVSPAFHRYVDRAREGRPGLGRLVLGLVLIAVVVALASAGAVVVALAAIGAAAVAPEESARSALSNFFATPAGIACLLASFAGMWVGVWLALRLAQRRPVAGVLGAEGRISWPDFARGALAALLTGGLSQLVAVLIDPQIGRGEIAVEAWLAWVPPLALLILLQSSAEEVVFRGYLLQSLAARWRHPLVWGGLPTLLFTLLHLRGHHSAGLTAAGLIGVAAVAGSAVLLVCRSGNLGAAMGLHFGANVCGILFMSQADWLNGAALFLGDATDWSEAELLAFTVLDLAGTGAALGLLLHRRSPLCLSP